MTEAEKKPGKRTGRPPKNPELGKRINVMFRLNEAVRDQLMRDAEASGRSMSEEIERRIEDSYRVKDIVETTIKQTQKSVLLSVLETFGLVGFAPGAGFSTAIAIANILATSEQQADMKFGGKGDWHKSKEKRDHMIEQLATLAPALVGMQAMFIERMEKEGSQPSHDEKA